MMNDSSTSAVSRRTFLKISATLTSGPALGTHNLTAAERARTIGSNDHIRIGMIGCGDRGRTAHMQGICKHLTATNFEIVALAPDNRTVTRRAFDLNRWEDYSFLEANLLGSVETGFVKHQAALVSVSNPLAP